MLSGCGRYAVVFNGEIYNFADRAASWKHGPFLPHPQRHGILLGGIQGWGPGVLDRLRGMFALRSTTAARSSCSARAIRSEENPCITVSRRYLYFAADLNALRAPAWTAGAVSAEAWRLYFSLGYVPAPHCILSGARKLASGEASPTRQGLRTWTYWDIALRDVDASLDEAAAVERLEGLLTGPCRAAWSARCP